jgi:hypothetical protein
MNLEHHPKRHLPPKGKIFTIFLLADPVKYFIHLLAMVSA